MANVALVVLIELALSLLMPCPSTCSSTVIKFLLMIPTKESTGIVPAVNQVLDEINRNVSFLPDHRLEYILREIECNGTVALENFFDVANDKSVKAVVGCGCSSATENVAKISHYLNTSVISYASTSVVLNDRSVYQSLYRTVPSDDQLVPALANVMFFNNWTQLTMFTESQPQFIELMNLLQQRLEEQNVTIKSTAFRRSVTSNYTTLADEAESLFDAQPHIYLPIANLRTQTLLLCAAFHNGRYYPNYAWILLGDRKTDWWRDYYMETNCSDTDMITVLNRSLVFIPYPDNGIYVINDDDFYNMSEYASDAVRAFAEALHSCVSDIGSGDLIDSCRGTELNWNVAFTGRTGQVRFTQNGNRRSSRSIVKQYQIRDRTIITLQSVGVLLESDIVPIGNSNVWPDGVPPDGTPLDVISAFVQVGVVVVYTILGIIVLVGAAICFIFTLVFRNRKVIKLTSPNLNYVLIIGVVVMTITNVTYPANNFILVSTICTINSFFSSIGYDVVIGIALVKTWRVFYIFKNPSTHKKVIKDWYLLIVVLLIAVVEVIFAVPLLALALHNNDVVIQESFNQPPSLNEQGILVIFRDVQCGNSIFFSIFFGITITYKLLLHGIGLVLSQLISNVKVQVLNDSRETVMTIFVTTVIILSGSVGLLSLVLLPNFGAIIWNITLFLVAIVNLTFTFIPKMVALYKDPKGEKVFEKMSVRQSTTQSTVDSIDTNAENASLKEKINQLERELSRLKNA